MGGGAFVIEACFEGARSRGPCIFRRMKINALLAGFSFCAALNASMAATPPAGADPFLWLEQAHGERAMKWVKAENVKTDAVLGATRSISRKISCILREDPRSWPREPESRSLRMMDRPSTPGSMRSMVITA